MREPARSIRIPDALRCALAAAIVALSAAAAPAVAADPATTLRVVLTSAEMSFDPQFSADAGTDGIIDHIYDAMLDYDYLARPVKLVPRTIEAMPTVEAGGAVFVFKLKRGNLLHAGPGLQGKAARAHGRRSGVCAEAPARSGREESMAVADRRQDHRRRRGSVQKPSSPGNSTTTRRLPDSRWSIATRCASG